MTNGLRLRSDPFKFPELDSTGARAVGVMSKVEFDERPPKRAAKHAPKSPLSVILSARTGISQGCSVVALGPSLILLLTRRGWEKTWCAELLFSQRNSLHMAILNNSHARPQRYEEQDAVAVTVQWDDSSTFQQSPIVADAIPSWQEQGQVRVTTLFSMLDLTDAYCRPPPMPF